MSESLESVVNDVQESSPVEDVKQSTVEAESETADESKTDEVKDESGDKETEAQNKAETQEPTEADKAKNDKIQKRFDRLTAARKAAEEKAARLEQELAEYAKKQGSVDDAPKEDDYDTFAEYNDAKIKYEAEKLVQERLQEQKTQELKAIQERKLEESRKEFQKLEGQFRNSTPDYDEKAMEFSEMAADLIRRKGEGDRTLETISQAIMESEYAPRLIYEIGGNPDLADDLAEMSPLQAAREIFKMEQGFSSAVKKESSPPPEPIKTGKARSNAGKPIEKMSGEELMKHFKLK